jgi:hypothetical protein
MYRDAIKYHGALYPSFAAGPSVPATTSLVIVRYVRTHLRGVCVVCIGTAPLTFSKVETLFVSVRPEH